jgi:hypothetical protein
MRFKKNPILILTAVFMVAGSLLLPASCVTAYGAGAYPAESGTAFTDEYFAVSGSPVKMEVTSGFEGVARSGRSVPLHIDLDNEEGQTFEGKIRIVTMESDYDLYEYDYPVSAEAGKHVSKVIYVPVGRADLLYVKLLDSQDQELIRKRMKMSVSTEVAELLIGVLADEPEQLSYLNGVGVNYSSVQTRTFGMTAKDIPDEAIGLGLLDILLITDYDTNQLTDSQVTAIWDWVKEGGTLLIGTGARADFTLAAFNSQLLAEGYPPPEMKEVDMGVEYAVNRPGESFIDLVVANITLKGGTEVLSNDQFPVLTSTVRGKGKVGVAAYDFVDIASFCQVQRSYVDKMFVALLGENQLNILSNEFYNGNSNQYWSVQNMLNTGNAEKLPNLPLYIVVIVGYIILVGPGLYFFLKKQERRRYYRPGVLVLSLVFTGIVYVMGTGTRFKSTFFTYATILDTSENTVEEYTYINMRTPYNKPYSISLDPSYILMPITRSNYFDMSPVPKFTGTEDYKVRIQHEGAETGVAVQNVASFTPKYYSLRRKTENPENIGLTGDVNLFEGKVTGTVTNGYSYPVEKVGIMMHGKMIIIDEMQAGETKSLNDLPVINYPINNGYSVSARVTGSYLYQKPDIEDPDYMLALSRMNILSFYLDRYFSTNNPEARIVAFSKVQEGGQFLAEGDYETYGMTMLTSALNVNTRQGERIYRSALMRNPTVVSGQYYADTNSANCIDPVALEYFLGSDIEVEKLVFETPSSDFMDMESLYYTAVFKGNIYFYNHDTGNYDLMKPGKSDYKQYELEPYLSPANTLTVKYAADSTNEYNWYLNLPMLNVVGRDK